MLSVLFWGVCAFATLGPDKIYNSACSTKDGVVDIQFAIFGPWGDWGSWSGCSASCSAIGSQSKTRTRDCCLSNCEPDEEGVLLEEVETEECAISPSYKCGDDSDNFRKYAGTKCASSDKRYLGVAGSVEECMDLYDAYSGKKEAFMLECYDDNMGNNPFACYACEKAKMESSSCGSKVYLDPVYDWNYGIIWTTLVLGILTLLGGFVADNFKLFGEDEEVEKKAREMNESDPLYVPIEDGAICPCFPSWMNLSLMTFVMCMFGFTLGAGLNIAFDTASEQAKSDWLKIIYYPGEIWIYALKLIVSPLISLMMVTLPDRVNVMGSQLGKHVLVFYICTSVVAACEGLFWVNVIKPGDVTIYLDAGTTSVSSSISELDSLLGIGRKAVPSNLVTAFQSSNVLGLITFFLTLGVFIQSSVVPEEWRNNFMMVAKAALKGIMLVIPMIVMFTPFAMVSIITYQISRIDDLQEILVTVGKYILTVFLAQGIHMTIFYPLVLFAFARINPYRYFNKIKRAPLTAFATSSSAATLPVSLDVLKRNDVRWEIVDFVAPLGSAINMDGTSCGFPIMCMWIAQMNNYDVDAGSQIVLALLSMTCSVGTAPIPNAGIVYVSMLLGSLGGPFDDESVVAAGVAFILIFDWLVDRIETMQNVWSDCVACKVFDAMGYEDLTKEFQTMELDTKRTPDESEGKGTESNNI